HCFLNNNKFNKKKVVFIIGATGTGKSRLSVDIVTHFRGEIINSDKMQMYKGLAIVTNKITHTEKQGVRHYLLGKIEQDSNFTAEDFCLQAIVYIEFFLKTQRVPIIVGGSNSYIEKLMEDPVFMFKYKYYTSFIWIDVEQSILNYRVDMRVDQMVNAGLVDVVRHIFIPDADYTKGIRRPIGVPEMDIYLREETNIDEDDESKKMLLQSSIANIKQQSVLNCTDDMKVDQTVNAGLVDEVLQIFIPDADYTKEIRQSIGVPEMDIYLREKINIDEDDELKKMLLQSLIVNIKRNIRLLICHQLDKIQRLINEKMWLMHHIIATDIFKGDRKEAIDEAWRNTVFQPCLDIVKIFLKSDDHNIIIE
ncbi:hypothetical protein MTR67_018518, partial [Solanum verrucosum]